MDGYVFIDWIRFPSMESMDYSSSQENCCRTIDTIGKGFGFRIGGIIKIDLGIDSKGIQRVHVGVVDPNF